MSPRKKDPIGSRSITFSIRLTPKDNEILEGIQQTLETIKPTVQDWIYVPKSKNETATWIIKRGMQDVGLKLQMLIEGLKTNDEELLSAFDLLEQNDPFFYVLCKSIREGKERAAEKLAGFKFDEDQ